MKKGVLLLAHGAPSDLNHVEEYVLHIRHGRPLAEDQMNSIKDRYKLVGGSPLVKITGSQAAALEKRLAAHADSPKVYMGMRHSPPFISETIRQMHEDGISDIVALCMAPQFSRLTIGAYEKALQDAIKECAGGVMNYKMVQSYARNPHLISAFSEKLQEARTAHPAAFVIFTAHSLPERVLTEGDGYDYEVKETARLTANHCALPDWYFAYQSQGMTSDKWLGPTVESRIDQLHGRGIKELLIAPIGFVCDHVEILYDIDVAFRNYAMEKGMILNRTASLNDSPSFIDLLFQLVSERL